MPPKRLISDMNGGFTSIDKPKSKYKPTPIDDTSIRLAWYKRDMVLLNDMFTEEGTKELIRKRLNNGTYGKQNRA